MHKSREVFISNLVSCPTTNTILSPFSFERLGNRSSWPIPFLKLYLIHWNTIRFLVKNISSCSLLGQLTPCLWKVAWCGLLPLICDDVHIDIDILIIFFLFMSSSALVFYTKAPTIWCQDTVTRGKRVLVTGVPWQERFRYRSTKAKLLFLIVTFVHLVLKKSLHILLCLAFYFWNKQIYTIVNHVIIISDMRPIIRMRIYELNMRFGSLAPQPTEMDYGVVSIVQFVLRKQTCLYMRRKTAQLLTQDVCRTQKKKPFCVFFLW